MLLHHPGENQAFLKDEGLQNKLKLKGKPDRFKKEDKKKLKKEKKKIDKHIETKIVDLSETDKNLYKLKKENSSSRKKGRTRDSYGTEQVSQFIIEDKSDGEKKKNKILKNKNMKNDKIIEVGMEDDLDEQNDANEAEGKESSKSRKKKRKSEKVKKAATNNVDELENEIEDGSYQQNGDENAEVIQSTSQGSKGQFAADDETNVNTRKSKKACKMKKELVLSRNDDRSVEKGEGLEEDEVYEISSGDEDCSRGKKKWITEYYQRRPGVKILQQRIDDFVIAHDAQEEQARKEREARAAEGGWTVVVHHKGRKKTTDTESGIVVGSVAQAAIMDKMDKKKSKEVGLDFYRFQKRESKRNEIMTLQSKFEQDIHQLRAARKFRPY